MPPDPSQLDMITFLMAMTAVLCAGTLLWVWRRFRDPLHPAVVLCPLLVVAYVWTPWQGVRNESIFELLPVEKLVLSLEVNLLFIGAYLLGCVWQSLWGHNVQKGVAIAFRHATGLLHRRRTLTVAVLAAMYAHVGYWVGISNAGGFSQAYGHSKGGGFTSSGYISESSLAGYPAFLLFGLSRQGQRLTLVDYLLGVLILAPNLVQGTLGGRRGPLFITLVTMVVGFFLARGTRPSARLMILATLAAAGAAFFVGTQRAVIYVGSEDPFDFSKLFSSLESERSGEGGTFTTGAGSIATAMETGKFHWGRRYVVTYFLRPIPRQLFADKESVYAWGNSGGLTETDWLDVMGWRPLRGSATGFVADIFIEFSWCGMVVAFLYGAFPAYLWRKARTVGGIWLVQLGLALTLMLYVPSQSVSAFMHRFLFAGILSWVAWRLAIGPTWNPWAPRAQEAEAGRSPDDVEDPGDASSLRSRAGAEGDAREPSSDEAHAGR